MRTVLISSDARVPAPVREIVERGSTALQDRRAAEVHVPSLERDRPDRVVLFETSRDNTLRDIARTLVRDDPRDAATQVVFVTAAGAEPPPALGPDQVFVWPRDEDRLKMAFMTGA